MITVIRFQSNLCIAGYYSSGSSFTGWTEYARSELPFAAEPLTVRTTEAAVVYANVIQQLFARIQTDSSLIELWLPETWGYQGSIPDPAVPRELWKDQVEWDASQLLPDDTTKFRIQYQKLSDGQIRFQAIRPAAIDYWRSILRSLSIDCKALRLAAPASSLEQILEFNLLSDQTAPLLPTLPKPKVAVRSNRTLILIFVAIIALGLAYLLFQYMRSHKSTPVYKTEITQPAKDSNSIESTQVVDTTKPIQAFEIPKFIQFIQTAASSGEIETIAISPDLMIAQLKHCNYSLRQMQQRFADSTTTVTIKPDSDNDRMTIMISGINFVPDTTFSIGEKVSTSYREIAGVTSMLSSYSTLPFRMMITREQGQYAVSYVR